MGIRLRLIICCLLPVVLFAAPAREHISYAFTAPPELRPRVNFWIDIFTRYGQYQLVFHHRHYPQAVFNVADLAAYAQKMSEVQFNKFKKKVDEDGVAAINRALLRLAAGNDPSNNFEQKIVTALKFIPGGNEKYKFSVDNELVRSQTGIKERFAESIQRSGRYMQVIERIFVGAGLPVELTRLPFIESSFNYEAYSSVGAAGIWQFMPKTGKHYGLKIDRAVDLRRDVISSSIAAAKYLKNSYSSLGLWPLAITSYNHGVTGVKRKVNENGTNNIAKLIERYPEPAFGFASTNFYPEFLAALEVYQNYRRYFPNLEIEPPLKVKEVELSAAASIGQVSKKTGYDVSVLKAYNYGLLPAVWAGRYPVPKGYMLRLPAAGSGEIITTAKVYTDTQPKEPSIQMPEVPEIKSAGQLHRVKSGESLVVIAKKYNVSINAIREWNQLKSVAIQPGQELIIKSEITASAPEATIKKKIKTNKDYYVVKPGDTLSSIAKKNGKTVNQLKSANKVNTASIKPGQKILIP